MRRYAALAFLSAFLLFLVQPLIAKAILPWFGGAPAVWTTSMLLFQLLLLGGYAYAHLVSRLSPRQQAAVHIVLLTLTLLALPIIPSASWKPAGDESPVWRILGLLSVTVGAPYLLLASTAPLVQDWFRRDEPGSPYRLYAWSNGGSLLALLAYQTLFEPLLAIDGQARTWSGLYVVFALFCGWMGIRRIRTATAGTSTPVAEPAGPATPPSEYALWFALSACGSGLLLAITNQISLDIAAFPFLWILPLALYLVTFVLCFGGAYRRNVWRIAFIIGLGAMSVLAKLAAGAPLWAQVGGSLFALFSICMVCHGELAMRAPAGRGLTAFYLTTAAGGAAGGVSVGLIAPLLFNEFFELPIFLITPYILMLVTLYRDRDGSQATRASPLAWAALVGVLWLGISAFVVPMIWQSGTTIARARNFYGVLRVYDGPPFPGAKRTLRHGRIVHGTQFLGETRKAEPTAYYALGSGVDVAIKQHPRRRAGLPMNIGAIGLGAGTIAAYGGGGDSLRFYEINADVVSFARRYFTFLSDSKATVDVVLGDGRLSVEREMSRPENRHRYDVLIVDAFSGDAIPIHLLTTEAMALYWEALKPDGILALHTSNRHVNLARVVTGASTPMKKVVVRVRRGDGASAISSTWLLVSSSPEFLHMVEVGTGVTGDVPQEPPVVWTDAFSNLLRVITLETPP
ncbi:MAG: hypothetical protein EXR93_01820 [Gemmatimonadetes bacterium]|nr:hypothetical protein [Gemmatimonadota bacterium]